MNTLLPRSWAFPSLILAILFCSFTRPAVATTPTSFTLYDTSFYPNSPSVFAPKGALRATVMYAQSTWPGTCTSTGCPNAPTQAQFQSDVTAYVNKFGSSAVIVFDYENLVISAESSTAAANNAVALFQQMIAWTRAIYPNAKIGMYDYDWTSTYAPGSSSGYNAIRAQLYQSGSSSFDFFAPTMYQRWSTHTAWDQNLAQAIINDSAINIANGVSKPIYPYVSPYASGTPGGTLLTDAEWTSELQDAVSCSTPSSTACKTVMATFTAVSGDCSYSGSTTACSSVSGVNLWAGNASGVTTNLSSTADWVLELLAVVTPPLSSNVQYTIASYGQSGMCIDAGTSGPPVTDACASSSTQTWTFTPLSSGNGTFHIDSYSYQQANLSSGNNSIWDGTSGPLAVSVLASGGTPTSYQQWQVVSVASGYYEFVMLADYNTQTNTDSETCLTASSGGTLTTAVCNGSSNQLFSLSVVTGSGAQSVADSQDAFITGGTNDNTNYGANSYLVVENNTSSSYTRETYLQFDLSGVTGTIATATVYLLSEGSTEIAIHQGYLVSNNSWTGSTITWNNAPAFSTTELGTWGLSASSTGLPVLFDATSAAIAAQSSSGSLSVGIDELVQNSIYASYGSRRSGTVSYRPLLIVNTN